MGKFIVTTFLMLGWAFYELSGGNDFVPEQRAVALADATEAVEEAPQTDGVQVARAATPVLIDLTLPMAAPASAPAIEGNTTPVVEAAAMADTPAIEVVPAALTNPASAEVEETVASALTETAGASLSVEDQTSAELTETVAAPETPALDLRVVAGSRVNMRSGPGTNFGVLDTLPGGTEAEVLETASGWARIRILSTNQVGWMAERLLDDI